MTDARLPTGYQGANGPDPGRRNGTAPGHAHGGAVPRSGPVGRSADGHDPVAGRVAALENALGDFADPHNPVGRRALLTADAEGSVTAEAERVLHEARVNEEFVPERFGGRLRRLDGLGRLMRPIFRRDASLGFGYGLNCFFAVTPIWTRGTPEQQRWAAWHLLNGGRLAVVRHEVAHGNDFVRDEFTAEFDGEGFWLNGTKTAIANAERARGLVVFARTEQGAAGGRSHSVLIVDRAETPSDGLEDLDRHPTVGLRGAQFGGLRATDCALPLDALVGEIGDGIELSLRSSLIVRGLLPSIVLAGADTALRTTLDFAATERRGGRAPLSRRHYRTVLTGAFLDLLISDCLALVATRSVHLMPTRMSAYAAAAAYLVPKVLTEATDDLAPVLGEEQYAEQGEHGMFAKHRRDLPMVALGHAGSAGRQVSILPQLPSFARSSWFQDSEPPPGLFRLHEDLPQLDLDRLTLLGDGDPLAATLVRSADLLEKDPDPALAGLREVVGGLVTELRELRRSCAELAVGGRAALTSPRSFALADRYVLVLAAAACLGVWREQRNAAPTLRNSSPTSSEHLPAPSDAAVPRTGTDPGPGPTADFLADPAWAHAALFRLGSRLGMELPERPAESEGRVFEELIGRHERSVSFDLYGTPLN